MVANMKSSAVLFDLDGTLLDSAPDYVGALNELLVEVGRNTIDFDIARRSVSRGAWALLSAGFEREMDRDADLPLRLRLLEIYSQRLTKETTLFDGIETLLDALDDVGTPWSIVTNKPGFLTEPIVEAFGLSSRAKSIVSGDTLEHAKPHPEPVLHVCREMGVSPTDAVMIGDARVDIEAGRAAGARTIATLYGYIPDAEDVPAWNADASVGSAAEILTLL